MKQSLYFLLAIFLTSCFAPKQENVAESDSCPSIFPDYDSVTIPIDIAPLDFNVDGADYVYATANGSLGGEISCDGEFVDFDIDDWHALTRQNCGGTIYVSVTSKDSSGKWTKYKPLTFFVSSDSLDVYGLTYRKIAPGYETFSNIGIFQRDIHTFEESPIVNYTALQGECLNCHVSNRCSPDQFQLHVRGVHSASLYQIDGKRKLLNTKRDANSLNCMYAYWHPSGRYIVYGNSDVHQCFWEDTTKYIEVLDLKSEIVVLDLEKNELVLSPVFQKGEYPQYPSFSTKGDTIYFCLCNKTKNDADMTKRYNLCAVSFDSLSGKAGDKIDTLFSADAIGKSALHPKPSYDGRYIVFSVSDYSVFAIHHPESDFYLYDLKTRQARKFDEINSDKAESYCNWSPNSKWLVLSSRRYNNAMSLLYIAHMGDDGKAGKPFLVPQRNPREFYHKLMQSYNVQDFTTHKVELDIRAFSNEVYSNERIKVGVRK